MWLPDGFEDPPASCAVPNRQMVMFHQDWVRWGFGKDLGEPGEGPFTIDYSGARPHPFLTNAVEIAAEVAQRIAGVGPTTVMLSGGIDSQAVAYAFKTADVPVRFLMARYNGGLNDHDLSTAEDFYRDLGIQIDVMDVDILAFHETELIDWGIRYECASPHLLSHMKIASLVEAGTVVFSGSPVSRDGVIGSLTWDTFALERFAAATGLPLVGYFLNHDPCLHYAFGQVPAAADHTIPNYQRKTLMFHQAGFPVVPQERKLHGFEKVKEYYDDWPISTATKLRYKDLPSNRPYDHMFRHPLMEMREKRKYNGARVIY